MFGGFSIISGFICLFVLKETKGLSDKELAVLYTSDKNDEVGASKQSILN